MNSKSNRRYAEMRTNRYCRKCFFKGILCMLAIIILVNLLFTAKVYNSELDGKVAYVEWSSLNLREKAGDNKDIITTLNRGNKVTLTGNHKEASIGCDYNDHWYEVEIKCHGDVITGWVYAPGIDF